MTLCERLNQIPPRLCRFVAHRRRRPLSNQDLSDASGLARSTIVKLSKLDRWDGVRLDMIEAFSRACGVDLLSPKTSLLIIRKRAMAYTRNANHQQRRMYRRLLDGLGSNVNNKA
ncbi:MAG TPA: hypothetical protein VFU31_00570 [Candidatus Binatia bacterium]|nr:hypothetical protein [Candidatus Binatia bacterium]